ncbi:coniferyl aldehyde dehydrogenase [Pseudomonas syringae]|uniref:Aldehyde dehydrogenase n=1 Tax=Pseudomonas syringae pv. actinidiae TaxID=103796 RepID=A0A2V0Q3B3_PSESF|nr:coniferyl aldehyde dehydrogenase [Pseudomonas syringae]EPN21456.1 aldehyde dehydrogenase [Pseudomonas syringae pv. actinidiae ICMP 19070]AQL35228.1 coniferyl-aldehyde dehydrogenase [Pseudomonas syringae pv. actinidiae ICMP 9853]EGH65325.1 aldehyde dehydrogenase [Pseudomonas syringae pv. actinidiae str. M302091]EPM49037.1 aldehyde dehydrogenase [Pseudomonas syringae pv. actinidiae ICMP 19103]EPM85285.1 aldehyde dehydrogenase [Pseudomonas syringae pv. actinidiae ICMP 19068]
MLAETAPQHTDPSIETMHHAFALQRAAFRANPMPSAAQRLQWLKSLGELLSLHRQDLIDAIGADFGQRSADETLLAELLPSLLGIADARKHVKRWMKPSRRRVGLMFQPASAKVVYQPLGVIGVIVPWNYPLFLAIGPLIGALAAGNRVMLKLSESTPATGALLKRLLANVFPEDLVAVVLGEAETGMAFSRLPFDHLLFTGATSIGKHVMRAAAENLTPVTLELGGKSPAIVSQDVPLQDAAERIAFGKTLNAGQTCIAPDYVLVPKDRLTGFVNAYTAAVKRFYPTLIDNPDYTAIINHRQLLRLNHYLEDAANKGAKIITLYEQGQDRRMPFSVLLDVSDDMLVMQDEIFGPLLPVVPYDRIEDAYAYINQRPRPLALYYFGYDKAEQRQVLERTHSGGVSINDTLMHAAQDDLPFGGVGPSGMGNYHGREGFLTFSQAKAVFTKQRLNAARLIYPPYGKAIQRLIYKLFMR